MCLLLPPHTNYLLGNKDYQPFSCIHWLSCGSCDLVEKLNTCSEEEDIVCCLDFVVQWLTGYLNLGWSWLLEDPSLPNCCGSILDVWPWLGAICVCIADPWWLKMRCPSLPPASPVSCLLVSALHWAWAENSLAFLSSAADICTWPNTLAKSFTLLSLAVPVLILLGVEAAALAATVSVAEVLLCLFFSLFCCRFKYKGLLLSFRTRLTFPFALFLHASFRRKLFFVTFSAFFQ